MLTRIFKKTRQIAHKISVSRRCGFDLHHNSPDRLILEDIIIPHLIASSEFKRILFVGCDWYTKPYKKFFKTQEYWTIEIDETKKRYGAKNHIIDSIQNLSNHVSQNYFDVIIHNGVFGYGVNTKEDTEESFNQCFQALRAGGILVFGWNDVPQFKPFPVIEECQSLHKFEPFLFAPLSTANYLTPNTQLRHTFNFYIKPVAV